MIPVQMKLAADWMENGRRMLEVARRMRMRMQRERAVTRWQRLKRDEPTVVVLTRTMVERSPCQMNDDGLMLQMMMSRKKMIMEVTKDEGQMLAS